MKLRSKTVAIAALAAILILTFSAAALAAGPGWKGGATAGRPSPPAVDSAAKPGTSALVPLSDAEKEALVFMREEEKLARDAYTVLYAKWGTAVFENIARSESRHMASVKTLLVRYGLADPVAVDKPGVFANAELQAAYAELVRRGSVSLTEALGVGRTIERLDIEDLQALLATSTHADVTRVARNLLRGSQNHLGAFTRLL